MNIFLGVGSGHTRCPSPFFLKGTQLAVDQLNVLSRSSCPLFDRACKTCDVPCCYPENKSYHRNLLNPFLLDDVMQLFVQIVLFQGCRLADVKVMVA